MVAINPLAREVTFKVVFYGPGLGGKTTSLQVVHDKSRPEQRGKLVSLATAVDRTLYFDYLPYRVPPVRGMGVRLQLFTVPGQVHYNATRKLVLAGADGVVFVADSQSLRADANLESFENLRDNLVEQRRELDQVPLVFQYNKRDLPDVLPFEQLERMLNPQGVPAVPTVALRGHGVFETLDLITSKVLEAFERRPTRALSPPPVPLGHGGEGGLAEALRSVGADGQRSAGGDGGGRESGRWAAADAVGAGAKLEFGAGRPSERRLEAATLRPSERRLEAAPRVSESRVEAAPRAGESRVEAAPRQSERHTEAAATRPGERRAEAVDPRPGERRAEAVDPRPGERRAEAVDPRPGERRLEAIDARRSERLLDAVDAWQNERRHEAVGDLGPGARTSDRRFEAAPRLSESRLEAAVARASEGRMEAAVVRAGESGIEAAGARTSESRIDVAGARTSESRIDVAGARTSESRIEAAIARHTEGRRESDAAPGRLADDAIALEPARAAELLLGARSPGEPPPPSDPLLEVDATEFAVATGATAAAHAPSDAAPAVALAPSGAPGGAAEAPSLDGAVKEATTLAPASFSFAELWPRRERDAALAAEGAMASGDYRRAVELLDTLASRVTSAAAALVGAAGAVGAATAFVPLLLGVNGPRYAGFRALVRDVRAGAPAEPKRVLAAYAVVVELVLAREQFAPAAADPAKSG